jgi:hypothetical protein
MDERITIISNLAGNYLTGDAFFAKGATLHLPGWRPATQ